MEHPEINEIFSGLEPSYLEEARETVATLIEDYKEFDKDPQSAAVVPEPTPEVATAKPPKSKNRK